MFKRLFTPRKVVSDENEDEVRGFIEKAFNDALENPRFLFILEDELNTADVYTLEDVFELTNDQILFLFQRAVRRYLNGEGINNAA